MLAPRPPKFGQSELWFRVRASILPRNQVTLLAPAR